jgi:hypothetical protein
LNTCQSDFAGLLLRVAPAINLGKRGSFIQYLNTARQTTLDPSFTQPVDGHNAMMPSRGHRAALDDFGAKASFTALNSFAPTDVRRDVDRRSVETIVPLEITMLGRVSFTTRFRKLIIRRALDNFLGGH